MLARVNAQPRPPASLGDGMLVSGGVKMFMDGSGGARTAWMHDDWNKNFTEKDTGNSGYPATPPDAYRQIVDRRCTTPASTSARTRSAIAPSTGSSTPTQQVLAAKPTKGLRHGIIHANTPTDHAIDVMARLQKDFDAGYPESQAPFTVVDWRQLRRQPRPGARQAAESVPHLREEGDQLGAAAPTTA